MCYMPNILFRPFNLKSIANQLLPHLALTKPRHGAQPRLPISPMAGPVMAAAAAAPRQHAAPPPAPLPPGQEGAQIAMTPLAWQAGLPSGVALLGYVDVRTLQLIELVAVEPDQMHDMLKVALFVSYSSSWQTMGEHRLCRVDFPPAGRFAQNTHPALPLEELLSLRWQASTELAQMDQALLLAKQEYDAALAAHPGLSMDACPPLEQALLALQDLRSAREGAIDEWMLLGKQIEAAFMQIGIPPPHRPTGPD